MKTTNLATGFALLLFLSRSPTTTGTSSAGAGAAVAPHMPVTAAASSDWFDDMYFALNAEGGDGGPIDSQTAKFLRSIKEPSMRDVISEFDVGLLFSRQGDSPTMSHFFATFFEGIVYRGYPFDDTIGQRIYEKLLAPAVGYCTENPVSCPSVLPLTTYPRTEMAQSIFIKYLLGGPYEFSVKQLLFQSYVVGAVMDPPLTSADLEDLPRVKLATVYAAVARASWRGASGDDRIIAAIDTPVWKYSEFPLRYGGDEVSDLMAIAFDHLQSRGWDTPAVDEDLVQFVNRCLGTGRENVGVIASKFNFTLTLRECAFTADAAVPCELPAHITHPFNAAMFLRFLVAPTGARKGEANYLLRKAGVTTTRPLLAEDLRTITATPFGDILGHIRAAGEAVGAPSPIAYAIDQIIH